MFIADYFRKNRLLVSKERLTGKMPSGSVINGAKLPEDRFGLIDTFQLKNCKKSLFEGRGYRFLFWGRA